MRYIKHLIFLLSLLLYTHGFAITVPLQFDLSHGAYFLSLDVSKQRNISLMIDTGSSNLNVVGNNKICPKCTLLINYLRFTPRVPFDESKNPFYMRYGLGDGTLRPYKGKVQLDQRLQLNDFDFGVYQQGENINNIIGLAYSAAAAPRKKPMSVFFTKLNQKYHLDDQFSLLLCDTRASSQLFLGALPEKLKTKNHYTVPIIHQSLYFVKQFGVSNANNKMLIRFKKGYDAIVDSGTSAKIVFPDEHLSPLINYLKQATYGRNKNLPDAFWLGQTCVYKALIDRAAFPTLYFHFKNTKGKMFKMKLPPKRYITESACGKDYYKLAFIGYQNNKDDKGTPNHKKTLPNFIILGTPFLEEYMTTFHQFNPAELRFYNSEKLCNNSYQAKTLS